MIFTIITENTLVSVNTPTVTFIIPFHNQEPVVEMVIRSVLDLDYPLERLNIIVIDDGSTDGTRSKIELFSKVPQVESILFDANRGRARARNAGLKKTTSELIALIDGDMVLEKTWLQELIKTIQSNNVIACMGETMAPPGYRKNRLDRYFYSYWRGARKHGNHVPVPFHRFLFNNTLIKSNALLKAGLFDDVFTGYGGEDTDLAIRMWRLYPAGLRFCPEARASHHHFRSLEQFLKDMFHFGKANLPLLVERYPHLKNTLGANWSSSISGKLVFNRFCRSLVIFLSQVFNHTIFIRYLVVESVVAGLRSAQKTV